MEPFVALLRDGGLAGLTASDPKHHPGQAELEGTLRTTDESGLITGLRATLHIAFDYAGGTAR